MRLWDLNPGPLACHVNGTGLGEAAWATRELLI